jgi:hypothetical protein
VYGLKILWLVLRFNLHRRGWLKSRQFESLQARYTKAAGS